MSQTRKSSVKPWATAASSPQGAITKLPPTKTWSSQPPTALAATIQALASAASCTKQPSETEGAMQVASSSVLKLSKGMKQMTSACTLPAAKESRSS